MSSLTASKKVLRALSLSLGGFQVLLLWKGVSCSLAVRLFPLESAHGFGPTSFPGSFILLLFPSLPLGWGDERPWERGWDLVKKMEQAN